MNLIDYIARCITEDPDVFTEEAMSTSTGMVTGTTPGGANKPLSATELSQEAQQAAGNKDSAAQIQKQLKADEEAKKVAQKERQKLLEPQLDKLNATVNKVSDGITQGNQNTASTQQRMGDLDNDMVTIRTIINNLGKSL